MCRAMIAHPFFPSYRDLFIVSKKTIKTLNESWGREIGESTTENGR